MVLIITTLSLLFKSRSSISQKDKYFPEQMVWHPAFKEWEKNYWSYLGLWLHPFRSMHFAERIWHFSKLQGIWRCSLLSNYLQLALRKTSDLIFRGEPPGVTHVFVIYSFQEYAEVVMPGSAIESAATFTWWKEICHTVRDTIHRSD